MSSRRQRKTEMITSKRGAELGSWFPWRNRKRKRENMALGEGSRLFQASSLGTVAGSLSMCPIENHLFIHSITQSINTKEYHSQVWPSYIPHAFSKHILCVIEPTFCLMRGEATQWVSPGYKLLSSPPLNHYSCCKFQGCWEMSLRVKKRWQVTLLLRVSVSPSTK